MAVEKFEVGRSYCFNDSKSGRGIFMGFDIKADPVFLTKFPGYITMYDGLAYFPLEYAMSEFTLRPHVGEEADSELK